MIDESKPKQRAKTIRERERELLRKLERARDPREIYLIESALDTLAEDKAEAEGEL